MTMRKIVTLSLAASIALSSTASAANSRYSNCDAVLPVLANNADFVADKADEVSKIIADDVVVMTKCPPGSGVGTDLVRDTFAVNAAMLARLAHDVAERAHRVDRDCNE
jgi:hypothetical protein